METVGKTVEDQKSHETNAWVTACRHLPSFERLGQPPKSRRVFAVEGFISDKRKKQGADGTSWVLHTCRWRSYWQHRMEGDPSHKRRTKIQDLTRHVFPLCGAAAPQRSTLRGNMARSLDRCTPEGGERKRNGSDGSDTDARQLSAVSRRLLKRWRDRRERDSDPPKTRGEREAELIASLTNGTREFDCFIGSFLFSLVSPCLAACRFSISQASFNIFPSNARRKVCGFKLLIFGAPICCACWIFFADSHNLVFFLLSIAYVAVVVQ